MEKNRDNKWMEREEREAKTKIITIDEGFEGKMRKREKEK